MILTFFLLSLLVLFLDDWTGGWTTMHLFCVYRSSLKDPLFYIRLFGHVLGHAGWEHFLNNMLLLLVVGPPMEEKYGSKALLGGIVFTALVTVRLNLWKFRCFQANIHAVSKFHASKMKFQGFYFLCFLLTVFVITITVIRTHETKFSKGFFYLFFCQCNLHTRSLLPVEPIGQFLIFSFPITTSFIVQLFLNLIVY